MLRKDASEVCEDDGVMRASAGSVLDGAGCLGRSVRADDDDDDDVSSACQANGSGIGYAAVGGLWTGAAHGCRLDRGCRKAAKSTGGGR